VEIRKKRGFENFPHPPEEGDLRAVVSHGPVVVINATKFRCDAFLVETDKIRALHLNRLCYAEIENNVKFMTSVRRYSTRQPCVRNRISRILEWLWDVAVGPILDKLGFAAVPEGGKWHRVWWIPTDLLSLLPLHAAGYHNPGSINTAMDRVVSSYSPSIKALLHARMNGEHYNPDFAANKALLISMESTPGYDNLTFAKEEANFLYDLLRPSIPSLAMETPYKDRVMGILGTYTIFHFAGHGQSHAVDPSKSCLILKDGQNNPLDVEHLMTLKLRSKAPWLAHLSARSTGENQVQNLRDEAIHLMTASQLAGFRHVVGSLWEVSDGYSVRIHTANMLGTSLIRNDVRLTW
jgi:hypothetical protein